MLWQLKPVCKWTRVWCDSRAGNIQPHNKTTKIEMKLLTQLLGASCHGSRDGSQVKMCFPHPSFLPWYTYPQLALVPFLGVGFMGRIPVHPYFSLISRVILHFVHGSEVEDVVYTYLRCWPTYSLAAVNGRGVPAYFKERVLLRRSMIRHCSHMSSRMLDN